MYLKRCFPFFKVFDDAQGSAKHDVQAIDQNGLRNIWKKVQANSRPTELSKRVFKVIVAVFLLKPMHKGVQAIMVVILWFKSRNWRHEVCRWLRRHGRCRRTCRQIRACWRCQIVMNNGCKITRS